jgi:hypothetical protein
MSRQAGSIVRGNSKPRRISVEAGRQQVPGIYCGQGKRSRYRRAEAAIGFPSNRSRFDPNTADACRAGKVTPGAYLLTHIYPLIGHR